MGETARFGERETRLTGRIYLAIVYRVITS
jgi:hypothetical protein